MSTAKSKAPLTASAFLGSAVKGVKPADAFFHVLPVPFVGERFKQSSMAAAPGRKARPSTVSRKRTGTCTCFDCSCSPAILARSGARQTPSSPIFSATA